MPHSFLPGLLIPLPDSRSLTEGLELAGKMLYILRHLSQIDLPNLLEMKAESVLFFRCRLDSRNRIGRVTGCPHRVPNLVPNVLEICGTTHKVPKDREVRIFPVTLLVQTNGQSTLTPKRQFCRNYLANSLMFGNQRTNKHLDAQLKEREGDSDIPNVDEELSRYRVFITTASMALALAGLTGGGERQQAASVGPSIE